MAKLTTRQMLRLIREHLDVEDLLAAHPEISRLDLERFWAHCGLEPAPGRPKAPARELFDRHADAQAGTPGRKLHLTARCDGAARGNPGPAAIGAVLEDDNGDVLQEISETIGRATSNVAEYRAVIAAVERALLLRCTHLTLLLDSDLLVQQLRGTYKVKAPHLRPLRDRALALLSRLRRWRVHHVPRTANTAADRLANLALDGKQP